jgi:aminopeptidase YwaD
MRKSLIFSIIYLVTCFFAKSQDMGRVRGNIDTLCSKELSGRGYVDNGDRKAADFISKKFKEIGLEAFQSNYHQTFQFPINTFPGAMHLKVGKKELKPGEDFIVEGSSHSVGGKTKVLALDTLVFTDSAASKSFLKADHKNVILLYRQKDYKKILQLPSIHQQKFYSFDRYIEVHDKKLTASVSTEQSQKITFQVLEKSLPEKIKTADFNVEADLVENYNTQNVIGYIPGSTHPDSLIVITAHYDHLGRMGRDTYFPGANDNASGISMLIELAHHYKANESNIKYTVVFIAFAAEEAGLIGSHFFVENPLLPLDRIKFLINLDLVGTGNEGITVVNGSIFAKEFELLTSINSESSLFKTIKKRGEAANSDHFLFFKKGVKSFFIYTLGGTTAYHDIYDTPSSLTFVGYTPLFKLLTEFIEKL